MPESKKTGKGWNLNGTRLDHNRIALDFTLNGERVRGVITAEALAAIVRGQVDHDANLSPGAEPTLFADFATNAYGPFAATPRLNNPLSLLGEINLVKAVSVKLGQTYLHELKGPDLEALKETWLKEKVAVNTIKRRLNALRRVIKYAVAKGLIKQNPLPLVTGLKSKNRAEIWLRTEEFDRLLQHCHPLIRPIVEYLGLTGARISEALDFRVGDLRDGRLLVPTEKRGVPCREMMREFNTASLGPRFARLEQQFNPHPKSGFYFYAPEHNREGRPLSYSYFQRLFNEARIAAGLPHIKPHDLRGSFSIHRSIVIKNFRQLMIEMGHGDARSIESYLARAQRFDPKDSYFYNPEAAPTAIESPTPATPPAQIPAKPAQPEPFPASATLH